MNKNLDTLTEQVITNIKAYIQRNAISRTDALEQRVVELEERLRALDGHKSHIGKYRPGMYLTRDL
ncbi:hypothetical protein ACN9MU_16580 [Pseudoduganella sp. R-32]|uniref:hypothetical protein n=1 Tax=Pseudoduganella sp. R-32 TaxID=3404061 RepID=UPI003CEC89FB